MKLYFYHSLLNWSRTCVQWQRGEYNCMQLHTFSQLEKKKSMMYNIRLIPGLQHLHKYESILYNDWQIYYILCAFSASRGNDPNILNISIYSNSKRISAECIRLDKCEVHFLKCRVFIKKKTDVLGNMLLIYK